jgi:hypothetical protein
VCTNVLWLEAGIRTRQPINHLKSSCAPWRCTACLVKSLSSALALLQELEEKEEEAANLRERVLLLETRDRNRASIEAIYAKMVALGIMDQVRLLCILHLMS